MFKWLIKVCIVTIITLSTLIIIKQNSRVKNIIYDYVYTDNISVAPLNKLYKKYFGNNTLLENKLIVKPVFNEKLTYNKKEKYIDGLKLYVDNNYLVPCINEGLVIFNGKKEGYGNVVIVQQIDGIDVWYGNLGNVNVKLYDYIEKGSLIGNCNDSLYLVFYKDGEILDYEEKI